MPIDLAGLKGLEWVQLFGKSWIATTAFGIYEVDFMFGGLRWRMVGTEIGGDCDSIDHGKELCWRDYQSRVRGLFVEPSKETTRSVRDNPQPGDVVRGVSGNNRLVTKLDGNDVYYRRLRGVREGTETRCWIKTWQDWAIGPVERTAAK